MPAQLPCRSFENHAGRFHRQRWHRIRLRPWRIKRAGAGKAGNPYFPFHFGIVRLEVRVGDRPIHQSCAGNRADLAALDKIDFVKSPEIRREVHAGPADASPVNQRALRLCFFVRRLAEGVRLKLRMIGELVQCQNFDFVVVKIGFRQVRALLQHNDAKPVRRKFLSDDPAGCTGADDDKVHFVGSFVFGLVNGHFLSASFAPGCQPE